MIYDTSKPDQGKQFKDRANHLYKKGARIEILEKSPNRTISQNNYLHLIIGWFALEFGDTVEYVKQNMIKKQICPDIFRTEFVNLKSGEVREEWRSTANLTKAEKAAVIERFRNYAAREANIYLPEPTDLVFLDHIKNEMELYKNKIYL